MNDLAERAERESPFMKGVAVGLGVKILKVGPSLVVTEEDAAKILHHLEGQTFPEGHARGIRFRRRETAS